MFFLLYKRVDDAVFDDFPKISDHFPKILKNCSEGKTNVFEHFRTIPYIFLRLTKFDEVCRRRLKKIRRCFDHRPTHFSVVEGTR